MKRKLLYPIIAALLAAAILVTMLTGCFGLYGSAAKLLKSGKNTLAQESFTVVATTTRNEATSTMTYQVRIDFESRDLTVVGTNPKQQIRFAIYQGKLLYHSLLGNYAVDIRSTVDAIFNAYENTDDFRAEQFLKALGEDIYDEISSKADMEELEKSMLQVYFDINSPFWLKKNTEHSKKRSNGVTYYEFSPRWDTLPAAVMGEFENAFYDSSDYDATVRTLQEELDDWEEKPLFCSIGVKENKIVSFCYTTETDEGTKAVTAELTHFGTTQIDIAPIEELLSTAHALND